MSIFFPLRHAAGCITIDILGDDAVSDVRMQFSMTFLTSPS
ncbi:MAG: hypothetical protein R3A52_24370 [Polyangiales bacterium]